MVEVFTTNVSDRSLAQNVENMMLYYFPYYDVNFDLQDKDRILRVHSRKSRVDPGPIMRLLRIMGFEAKVLDDHIPNLG
ncbi:hypothetical protein E1176_14725 [Fulvivirga sp. RKSG066]|uniref:hypothetical protein n=1 Tax=Fulvivirga aurantia TaxID=2529383 RepID=UPI0012BBB22A|nr:hypothetical protein [Fulvivirga aurantia]MTI22283.1 hypothetical protein [Fulvivirga aurantia]